MGLGNTLFRFFFKLIFIGVELILNFTSNQIRTKITNTYWVIAMCSILIVYILQVMANHTTSGNSSSRTLQTIETQESHNTV